VQGQERIRAVREKKSRNPGFQAKSHKATLMCMDAGSKGCDRTAPGALNMGGIFIPDAKAHVHAESIRSRTNG